MPATYEPIATTTLSSEASTITFSSISSAYTDLRIVMIGFKPASVNTAPMVRFNSDSSTNYSYVVLQGTGSSASSQRYSNTNHIPLIYFGALITAGTPSLGILDIFNYAGSTFKTALNVESGDVNTDGRVAEAVGVWRNTSAITSITITDETSRNFGVNTIATLYGIKKA